MNPDQHFPSSLPPPPPPTSFRFPYDHHHSHQHHHNRYTNNDGDDNHRALSSKKIHHLHPHRHPHAKTDVANINEVEEDEIHTKMITSPSSAPSYVITMPSCPSSSSTSTSAYSSPSSSANMPTTTTTTGNRKKSYKLQQSKEPAQAAPSMSPSDRDEFYAKNICKASVLVVSYLIEMAIQIWMAVQCYLLFQQEEPTFDLFTDTTTEITSSFLWVCFLIISSVLSSLLVTMTSLIWVYHGMDFSGRLCGRLLCYVMHSFLLGLVWRYIKLVFIYDKTDVEEFFRLKTIRTYVQTLPLVTIHLAWILTTQQQLLPFTSSPHDAAAAVDSYHALSSWLVVVEMLSAVISILILSSSTVSSCTYKYRNNGNNNNNLQVIDVAAASSPSSSTTCSSPGDNPSKAKSTNQRRSKKLVGGGNSQVIFKLNVECGSGGKGDNNPNHHFNDSGTASSVDNHGAAESDENDIEEEEKSSCAVSSSSSSPSLKTLMTIAIKWMMSHYSQKCEPGRALLLVSRVISLGMLVYKMNCFWTGFIALLHFGVSSVWLGCWTSMPSINNIRCISDKLNGNIKTALSTSTKRVHDSNDTCCDTRSTGSSSNDSGLVVKSEVLMENGIPVAVSVPGLDDDDGDIVVDVDDNDGEGHNNVDYSVNSCTRGGGSSGNFSNNDYQIQNKTVIKRDRDHHVNSLNSLSGGLSGCLSFVAYRRNRNAGNRFSQQDIDILRRRYWVARVSALTYVLFWDLSSSPCAYQLSMGHHVAENTLSLWASALPVFLALVENVFITVYNLVWISDSEPSMRFLTVSNALCLVLGWLLVTIYQFRWRSGNDRQVRQRKLRNVEETSAAANDEEKNEEDDVDSGYGKNKGCIASGGGDGADSSASSDASVKSINKKETGECLSFCCSSLSHPLNIKRKGRHRDQRQQEEQQEANNFCKDSSNDKLSPVDHQHQPRDVTIVKYNEYQEQQELGKLMSTQRRQHHHLQQQAYNLNSHNNNNNNNKLNDDGSGQSSRNNSTIIVKSSRGVAKKPTIFPDLGISSDHTGVNVGEEGHHHHYHHHLHQDNYNKICSNSSTKPESMMRCRDDVKLTNKACATITGAPTTTTTVASVPVTNNNYTDIKEALTRRISNKSGTNGSLKKSHQYQQQRINNRASQDRESVKGDGEVEEGEPRVAISSFKLSSSSSTRLHHHHQQQQQHQAMPTNSNKCMPISIKSPISWLPETCCNDSNGSGTGSSNSRNTNTLVMPEPTAVAAAVATNGSRLFYCPEKYIDLGNNTSANIAAAASEETEESNRTSRKLQQPKQQRQQPHQHHHLHNNRNPDSNEGNRDFSVVFFEGRAGGGGTSRSYKQKKSRTPVASNALLLRAARSANSTPVAYSKPFPLDIGAITGIVQKQQQQTHPCFQLYNHNHHHQYSSYNEHDCDDDDDEVDPIEQAKKEKGASHRRIRNQITGKTYLSDGASLTSLDGLCEIRASTPVEIKKASRVIVNYPPPHHQISDSKTVSRCLCKVDKRSPSPERVKSSNRKPCGLSPLLFNACDDENVLPTRASGTSNNNNNIYEKLIDDSYGILICEGENAPGKNSLNRNSGNSKSGRSNACTDSNNDPHHQVVRLSEASELRRTAGGGGGGKGGSQKLKILCAKCLENHDPLLTNCVDPLKLVVDEHLPEIVDCHFSSAANNINNLVMMQNWQEQNHHRHSRSLPHQVVSDCPYLNTPAHSDTTDYPSDTEFTTNNNPVEDDGQSLSTHFSSVTYTWHQHHQQHHNYQHQNQQQQYHQPKPTQLSQFIWAASTLNKSSQGGCDDGGVGGSTTSSQQQECPKEFTGLEYVRTWLMASHPRTFAINNISHINSNSSSGCNDTHQHPLQQSSRQQENSMKKKTGKNSNGGGGGDSSLRRYATYQHHLQQGISKNDKGLTLLSSMTASKNPTTATNVIIPFKHKSACDKPISKKKKFRQLEKRQRPIGRGASPPAKELATAAVASNNNNNFNGNVEVLNSISVTVPAAVVATNPVPTLSTANNTISTKVDTCGGVVDISAVTARFQPPPSRKQHPLLFYDMIPRQEQQKPLTATSHKKCRDQLDLFHKELETVV